MGHNIQFGISAVAMKRAVAQFHITGPEHPPVGELFAHVAVVHAAGEHEADRLTRKIFHDEIFHTAILFLGT